MENSEWKRWRQMVNAHNISHKYNLEEDEISVITDHLYDDMYAKRVASNCDPNDMVENAIRFYMMGRDMINRLALRL